MSAGAAPAEPPRAFAVAPAKGPSHTVRGVIDARGALTSLAAKELPSRLAFQVLRALEYMDRVADPYAACQRSLLEKYGEPSKENPDTYAFPTAAGRASYLKEIGELDAMPLTVPAEARLDVALMEPLKWAPAALIALAPFLSGELPAAAAAP